MKTVGILKDDYHHQQRLAIEGVGHVVHRWVQAVDWPAYFAGDEFRKKGVRRIILAHRDYLTTDAVMYEWYRWEIKKRGIDFIVVDDKETDVGRFVDFLLEKRQDARQARSQRRKAAKGARGGYTGGRPPYGYRVERRKLVSESSEARVVRWVFKMRYQEGRSFRAIERALADRGHKTRGGSGIRLATIQRMLKNEPLYRGYVLWEGKYIKGEQELILEGEEFYGDEWRDVIGV